MLRGALRATLTHTHIPSVALLCGATKSCSSVYWHAKIRAHYFLWSRTIHLNISSSARTLSWDFLTVAEAASCTWSPKYALGIDGLFVVWVDISETWANSWISLLLRGFQWKDVSTSMAFVGHAQQDKGQLLRKWLTLASASLDWKWMAFSRPFLVTLDFSRSTHKKICSVIAPCSWPYIVYTWCISLMMDAHYSWGI